VLWQPLIICVQEGDQLAARLDYPPIPGCAFTFIRLSHQNILVVAEFRLTDSGAVVSRSIVDDDNLVICVALAIDGSQRSNYIWTFIEKRDDN
jgi:hypothetical protein